MNNTYRAVILSPHLDDAVFSCGGEIARLRKDGPVLVLNIFTRYLAKEDNTPVLLGDARYEEERNAARLLNYEHKNLNELDAFFRHAMYRSIGNIFKPLSDEDMAYLERLKKLLHRELETITFDRLYVPLAIGWHVDHHLTFLAMIDSPYKDKILFYEDAPYCLIDTATDSRLLQLSGNTESWINFVKRWWRASIAFYNSGMVQTMQPAWQRMFAFPITSYYLYGMTKSHLRLNRAMIPIDQTPHTSDVTEYFDIKMEAADLYASQVKAFFLSGTDMRACFLLHVRLLGFGKKYVERFWKFS